MALDHPQESSAFTKVPALDALLGVLSGLVMIGTGLGIAGGIFIYVQYKKRYPYYCMGLVISVALTLLLLLGLFLVCIGGVGRSSG